MSTLLIDELYNGIEFSQPFKINKDMNIAHVRPWIYRQGTLADGEFVLEVYDGAELLATSRIDYTDINAAFTENYAHGMIRFDFLSLALNLPEDQLEKEFIFKFYMDNHTTDTSNFLAIVRRWEDKSYATYGAGVVNNEADNDYVEPAGFEIFEYRSI